MRGVLGKPYISTDSYINVKTLIDLDIEICQGIARAKKSLGNYGSKVLELENPRHNHWGERELSELPSESKIKIWAETLQHPQEKRLFLKLALGVYNPYTTIYVRQSQHYYSISDSTECQWTENKVFFPGLVEFIGSLPFQSIGRVVIFLQEHFCKILIHKDLSVEEIEKKNLGVEFLWLRPNLNKHFFIYDEVSERKHVVESYSAYFNPTDYHGGDAVPRMTYSIRVDGVFSEDFRKSLGLPV